MTETVWKRDGDLLYTLKKLGFYRRGREVPTNYIQVRVEFDKSIPDAEREAFMVSLQGKLSGEKK